jgi:hypothetical protein
MSLPTIDHPLAFSLADIIKYHIRSTLPHITMPSIETMRDLYAQKATFNNAGGQQYNPSGGTQYYGGSHTHISGLLVVTSGERLFVALGAITQDLTRSFFCW